ncbi:Alpha/Beta hydrolase protein [Thamnocephalis sphaerospora]|uniref:Alpha/Beta hydrolase protein n=1 Tax=Thamnocephalis sphaerospora TaxID=78915 RepID=A0A4P9XKN8_9FUNG|nr:Alpha/Beta hydrolase protein [Thamnocephalis sphaerospora]|eukprot:RKP06335.1 Alpha/Beta hydrolase protein [Thamnocephalis sphaerospora]
MSYCNATYPAKELERVKLGKQRRPLLVDGFTIVKRYEKDSLAHYVAVNNRTRSIQLVFRGSDNLQNYITAVQTALVPADDKHFANTLPGPHVFEGYQEAAIAQMDAAADAVAETQRKYPNYATTIIGHSLGGAMAHYAAHYIRRKRQLPILAVYTLGEPTIATVEFADKIVEQIGVPFYRIVSSNDVVPFIDESPSLGTGPATRATEIYCPDPNAYGMIRCKNVQDPRCSRHVPCTELSWDHHSDYAGFRASQRVCLLSQLVR